VGLRENEGSLLPAMGPLLIAVLQHHFLSVGYVVSRKKERWFLYCCWNPLLSRHKLLTILEVRVRIVLDEEDCALFSFAV